MSKHRKKRASFGGSGSAAKEIGKLLEAVRHRTGIRLANVFNDWLEIVCHTLEALPEQIKNLAATGRFQPDSPEVAAVFERVRRRYQQPHRGRDDFPFVWEKFGQALATLLAATERGLWSPTGRAGEEAFALTVDYDSIFGPDILAAVYTEFSLNDTKGFAQYFSPWSVAVCMAAMSIPDGEREVHDRLKAALFHPDNIPGQSALLAGMLFTGDNAKPEEAWRYFVDYLIPLAMPYYRPVTISDPAAGSSILLLAAVSRFPRWAVHYGLVTVAAADIDFTCILLSRANFMLFGLNGYGLKLELAAREAMAMIAARETDRAVATLAKPASIQPEGVVIPQNGATPSFQDLYGRALDGRSSLLVPPSASSVPASPAARR